MEEQEQEQEQEVVKGFKSHIPLIVGVLAALALCWYLYKETTKYVKTDDAFVDSDKVGIAPKIIGRVAKVYVDETDTVKKGSLLAELDSIELKSQQSQTEAAMQQNQVSVQQAEAEFELSKENKKILEINFQKAGADFSRAKAQYDGGVITQENFEHAQKSFETAQANFAAAEKQVDYTKSQIPVATAKFQISKAQYDYVNTQLQNTRLYAPFDGVIARRWLLPGDVAMAGQSVYTLVNDKTYWISVFVEEANLSSITIGSKALVNIDAFPDITFEGKVYYIASNTASQFSLSPPNNAAGNFTKIAQRFNLKVSIDSAFNKKRKTAGTLRFLPGMSAVVKIIK